MGSYILDNLDALIAERCPPIAIPKGLAHRIVWTLDRDPGTATLCPPVPKVVSSTRFCDGCGQGYLKALTRSRYCPSCGVTKIGRPRK